MKCIADVNVLLPLVCGGHAAEKSAYRWFDGKSSASVGWCLLTRLAILRHLCNRHIMGASVLEPERALKVWARLQSDERFFEIETLPEEIGKFLRENVAGRAASPNLWTDAWIAALAEASGLQMVSFDQDFRRFKLSALLILEV